MGQIGVGGCVCTGTLVSPLTSAWVGGVVGWMPWCSARALVGVPNTFGVNDCTKLMVVWTPTDLATAPIIAGGCIMMCGSFWLAGCSAWSKLLASLLGECSARPWGRLAVSYSVGKCSARTLVSVSWSVWTFLSTSGPMGCGSARLLRSDSWSAWPLLVGLE